MWKFEILAGPYTLTEGPVWDGKSLLFTDIDNSRVLRDDAATGYVEAAREATNGASGLALDPSGGIVACESTGDGRRVVRYEPDGSTSVVAERYAGKRFNSPNDLAIDELGRVWFTDPRYGPDRDDMELDQESVYRASPTAGGTWALERVVADTIRPNGILVSHDGATLYIADSSHAPEDARQLRSYNIAPDGCVKPLAVLHDFGDSRGIDGMCLDTAGNILACCGWELSGPGGRIAVFGPDGTLLEEHHMPEGIRRPTNCTFGGADLDELYVTDVDGHLLRAVADRQSKPPTAARASR